MSNELRFASANQALQHLADVTGQRVRVGKKTQEESVVELREKLTPKGFERVMKQLGIEAD